MQPSSVTTPTASAPLEREFFARATLQVARDLLGTLLVRELPDGTKLSGWIAETEAYVGSEDLACHARHGRTDRNETMWGPPGHAYVYFTYGMHWLLNAVTERDGFPAAVLLRALHPRDGLPEMRKRRTGRPDTELTNGPAKLCQALAIDGEQDKLDMCARGAQLRFHKGIAISNKFVTRGPRVGLNNVPEPWLSKPWRFRIEREAIPDILSTEGEL